MCLLCCQHRRNSHTDRNWSQSGAHGPDEPVSVLLSVISIVPIFQFMCIYIFLTFVFSFVLDCFQKTGTLLTLRPGSVLPSPT